MRRVAGLRAWTGALLLAAGCGSEGAREQQHVAGVEPPRAPERVQAPLAAFDEAHGSGATVALARLGGKRLAFVAHADDRSIVAVDVGTRAELARTAVRGSPSAVVMGDDGRLYAALRDENAVAVLESTGRADGSLMLKARIATNDEPVAVAVAGETLLVATGWGHSLEAYSTGDRGRRFVVDLAREPRAIALSSDGKKAFVSHMVGSLGSVVDLERGDVKRVPLAGGDLSPPEYVCDASGKVSTVVHETRRTALQGFAAVRYEERLLLPGTLVRTGDPDVRTDGYGQRVADLPSHVFDVAAVGADADKPAYPSVHVQMEAVAARVHRYPDCLLPRGAAVDETRASILVACADIGAVLELDPRAADPARAEKRRFRVGEGPTGVAVDAEAEEAFAWSQTSHTLDVLVLGEASAKRHDMGWYRSEPIPIRAAEFEDRDLVAGKRLFHLSGDKRIARDGRACASCHPDGRDDGLTWPTPDGPRQPPMLAGRLRGTAPYSWTGGHATLEAHLGKTLDRLGGRGLSDGSLALLIGYVTSLQGPSRAHEDGGALARRGHELFVDPAVGCAGCHREESAWTDQTMHDVSSRARADKMPAFDTPSLRFVGGTAPYFHDGRYATLAELLRGAGDTMGNASHLGDSDLAALEAYLKTL